MSNENYKKVCCAAKKFMMIRAKPMRLINRLKHSGHRAPTAPALSRYAVCPHMVLLSFSFSHSEQQLSP
jgi:hypothetical protein